MVKAGHRSFFVNDECVLCKRKISGKKSSNLRRHLERFHAIELAEFEKTTPPIKGNKKLEVSAKSKDEKLQNELIDFFISTGISLDLIHNHHLRAILKAIPNFTIPTLEDMQIKIALKLLPLDVESSSEGSDEMDIKLSPPQ